MKKMLCCVLSLVFLTLLLPSPVKAAAPAIVSVEVTQVMGKGIDLNSGKYYFMNMFVAGKSTVIQVTMDTPIEPTENMYAMISKAGEQEVHPIRPVMRKGKRQVLEFVPSMKEMENWPEGRYNVHVTVGNAEKKVDFVMNAAKDINVLIVPAQVTYDSKKCLAPSDAKKTDWATMLETVYPVRNGGVKVKINEKALTFGNGKIPYDIAKPEGASRFLQDIQTMRTTKEYQQYDYIVAYVSSHLDTGSERGNTAGYTDTQGAVAISSKFPDKSNTLLHEIGHNYGLGDEYEGGSFQLNINGAPYQLPGFDSSGKSVKGNKSYLKNIAGTGDGIALHEQQNAYNTRLGGSVGNTASFMGNAKSAWTTSLSWETVYQKQVLNHNNVFPRVYTDGTVQKVKTPNEMTSAETASLQKQYLDVINKYRKEAGTKALAIDSRFNAVVQAAMDKAMLDNVTRLDGLKLHAEIEASAGVRIYCYPAESYIHLFEGFPDLEDKINNSECFLSTVTNEEYSIIVPCFFKRGSQIYHAIMYYGSVEKAATSKKFTFPKDAPKLETNPVTDETGKAALNYEDDISEPPESVTSEQEETEPTNRRTLKPPNPQNTTSPSSKPKTVNGVPEFHEDFEQAVFEEVSSTLVYLSDCRPAERDPELDAYLDNIINDLMINFNYFDNDGVDVTTQQINEYLKDTDAARRDALLAGYATRPGYTAVQENGVSMAAHYNSTKQPFTEFYWVDQGHDLTWRQFVFKDYDNIDKFSHDPPASVDESDYAPLVGVSCAKFAVNIDGTEWTILLIAIIPNS